MNKHNNLQQPLSLIQSENSETKEKQDTNRAYRKNHWTS